MLIFKIDSENFTHFVSAQNNSSHPTVFLMTSWHSIVGCQSICKRESPLIFLWSVHRTIDHALFVFAHVHCCIGGSIRYDTLVYLVIMNFKKAFSHATYNLYFTYYVVTNNLGHCTSRLTDNWQIWKTRKRHWMINLKIMYFYIILWCLHSFLHEPTKKAVYCFELNR